MIRKIHVGKKDELKEGRSASFHFGPIKGIALNRAGVCKAYVNRCTHMGGPVSICGTRLKCGWHGAEFDPDTGAAIQGEAPAGTFLKKVEIVEEDGTLYALLELPDDPFA